MGEQLRRPFRPWRRGRRLSWRQFWLVVQSLLLLPSLGLALRSLGFRRLYGVLTRSYVPVHPPADGTVDASRARAISDAVQMAAWHGPVQGTCLTRSLALWLLLRRQGLAGELRLGVTREANRFRAHAWVEFGGEVLNDSQDVGCRFSALPLHDVPDEVWLRSGTVSQEQV